MTMNYRALWGAFVLAVVAVPASAACPPPNTSITLDGSETKIDVTPKSPDKTQPILVIPVVDKSYAYDAAKRTFAGSPFESQLPDIQAQYQQVADYWVEASYGNVKFSSVIPKCFYQIKSNFPTTGQKPFQRASLTSAELQFYNPLSYSHIAFKYLADPAAGEKSITFTGDPTETFAKPEALVADLKSQLGTAADDFEILVVKGAGGDIAPFNLVFQIVQGKTHEGSYVHLDVAGSDAASRKSLGLTLPTFQQTSPGVVTVTSDQAVIPGQTGFAAGTNLVFNIRNDTLTQPVYWTYAGSCSSSTPCPTWNNAADLAKVLKATNTTGVGSGTISDTTVGGHPEFKFTMNVPAGNTYTSFTLNDVGSTDYLNSVSLAQMGLATVKTQTGTASLDAPLGSEALTRDALESFLTQELSSTDVGCLTPEITNPMPGTDVKAFVKDYLKNFSAIQVYLLSQGNVRRENANHAWMCTDVAAAGTTTSVVVYAPVALVETSSGAATIAHETGHDIGFPDLYNNSNTTSMDGAPSDYDPNLTFPGGWEVMADQSLFPHPSSFTKQYKFGWLQDGALNNNGDIHVMEQGTDETIILTPLERPRAAYEALYSMPRPAGEPPMAKMIVLKLGGTGNSYIPSQHFLAIENRQQGVKFSQGLPGDQPGFGAFQKGGVRVSDNILDLANTNPTFTKPISRNFSQSLMESPYQPAPGPNLKIPNTLDTTKTFPAYPAIKITSVEKFDGPGSDPTTQPPSYKMHVVYGQMQYVDLSVQPWRAPDQYASNAIWFEYGTSETPPANPFIPPQDSTDPKDVGNVNPPVWLDNYSDAIPLNWIHVLVKNNGKLDVDGVQVKATYASPNGAGDPGEWKPTVPDPLSDKKSIPAGGSAVFSIKWNPDSIISKNGHTCVAVEILNWTVAGLGQVADSNPNDNWSQENIFDMPMKHGSPWHDVPFEFNVTNTYDHEVPVLIEPRGIKPGYRVQMPETALVLAGGQSHLFEGTYGWDPAVIPLPPNDNPTDPYWQACTNGGTQAIGSTYFGLDMYHSTGYGVEGPGWVLDENGFVSTNHDFVQGVTTISVFASGWYIAGAWPHMRVYVDGAQIGQADVASEDLVEYSFTYSGPPGTREIRVAFDNGTMAGGEPRSLYVDSVDVETLVPPSYCGGVWGLTAWALLGDYRVPLGGTSFHATAQPVGTLTTTTSVNSTTGDVTVTGTVTPPAGGQPVRIFVRYPSGRVDILVLTTDGGGHVTTTFPPKERGPLTVSSELPEGGGPFGPTDRTDTTVDACIPTGVTATCSDHIQNQGETGVDCGGPCPPCVPSCTAATAVDLGAPGTNKTVPVSGCVKVQNAYPTWWGTRAMRLETFSGGAYPVPFTWSNTCSGSAGSGTFTADFQSKVLTTTSQACVTLIDLTSTGSGNVTLRYWAN